MSEHVVTDLVAVAESLIKQGAEANACGDHVESRRLAMQATQVYAAIEVLRTLHRIEALLTPLESFRGEAE